MATLREHLDAHSAKNAEMREPRRCNKWIGGMQCHHFVMVGRDKCALHGKGTHDLSREA